MQNYFYCWLPYHMIPWTKLCVLLTSIEQNLSFLHKIAQEQKNAMMPLLAFISALM